MIRNILLVALGGAAGSALRYVLSALNVGSLPWGTLLVNVAGSLLIGLLTGLVGRNILSPEAKLLLVTGFCGGFTTFSTYMNESFGMLKADDLLLTALYVGGSVVAGLLAVWAGMTLAR